MKTTAIYARRSVSDKDKGNNSLSIDSQITECVRSLEEGAEYKVYCDDGKSGKDIQNRPAFMQMMSDAKDGIINRIVVKKYDRFSRNMREYLNITNELDRIGVSVFSLSEPFNTTTKEGRMMRNTLLSFAEFERETIAARVADAYSTRSIETGFFQGGREVYFGFQSERRTVNGKTGSVLVPSPEADALKLAYDMYKNPKVSLRNVIEHFREADVEIRPHFDRGHLSRLLCSPLYVRADVEVYQYLMSKGYDMIDDISAYNGVHGLFRHKRADGTEYIKVGYHEGLVDAETWLAVQDKKSTNKRIPKNGTARNSWLVGLAKCGHCEKGLNIVYSWNASHTFQWRYWTDRGAYAAMGCVKKRLRTRPDEVEQIVYASMCERLNSLVIAKAEKQKPNTEVEKVKADIVRAESEIQKLMDKLADADAVLFDYIQERVKILHSGKAELEEKLRSKTRKQKEVDTEPLSNPMSRWDSLTVNEKHALATVMLEAVYVSDEGGIDIRFAV